MNEVFRLINSDKKFVSMLIIVQVILSYLAITTALNFTETNSNSLLRLSFNSRPLHQIGDNFRGEDERAFLAHPSSLYKIHEFYTWLNSNEDFTFIAISWQSFFMKDHLHIPNKFRYGYEFGDILEEDRFKSVQVNSTFFEHFDININYGRGFNYTDFDFDNAVIPLLLGYEYRDYVDLGETIEFYYITGEFTGEVIGFIEKDAFFLW